MRMRVFLNPSDTTLVGKYANEHEHVHVVCDSSNAAFTVILPDLMAPEHKEFIFYNLPETGAGNTVTVIPQSGQLIQISDTSHALAAYDTACFVSDMKKRWLLSDVNH